MIFIDLFFVNNSNLFSQIDYVICLTDVTHANILHWFSIKCERMTRNVLTAELFAMIHDFDVSSVLKSILFKMLVMNKMLVIIFLILITNSKFLYVRLGTVRFGSVSVRFLPHRFQTGIDSVFCRFGSVRFGFKPLRNRRKESTKSSWSHLLDA